MYQTLSTQGLPFLSLSDGLGAFYWNRSFLMIREQVSLTLNECTKDICFMQTWQFPCPFLRYEKDPQCRQRNRCRFSG